MQPEPIIQRAGADASNHVPPERTVAVVLNWRSAEDTIRCAISLLAIERALDIILVDNNSDDGSFDQIRAALKQPAASAGVDIRETAPAPALAHWNPGGRTLLFVQSGSNRGYAAGNNVGIKIALQQRETSYVWILNADTVVPGAATLDALVARMVEDKSIGLCGATVLYLGRDIVQTRAGGSFELFRARAMPIGAGEVDNIPVDQKSIEAKLAYINGAASFVKRAFIENIGLMREDYFLYFEEFDWAKRARGKFRLGYAPDAVVLHKVGGSIGTNDFGESSPLSVFYMTRNRIRFLSRYYPFCLPLGVADEFIALFRNFTRGQKRQAWARLRAIIPMTRYKR